MIITFFGTRCISLRLDRMQIREISQYYVCVQDNFDYNCCNNDNRLHQVHLWFFKRFDSRWTDSALS